jgi:hypothetical protein
MIFSTQGRRPFIKPEFRQLLKKNNVAYDEKPFGLVSVAPSGLVGSCMATHG